MEGAGGGGQRGGMQGAHAAGGRAMHGGVGHMPAAGAGLTTYASTASALKPRAMLFGTPGQHHAGAAAGRLHMPPQQHHQQHQHQRVASSTSHSSSRPGLPGMPTGIQKKRSSSAPRLGGPALLQQRTSAMAQGLGGSVRRPALNFSEYQALIEDSRRLGRATPACTPGISSPVDFVNLSAIEDEEKARQAGNRAAAARAQCERLKASIQEKLALMRMISAEASAAGMVPSSAQRALMDRQGGDLADAHAQASRLYEPILKFEAQRARSRAAERSPTKVAERAAAFARRKAEVDALAAALKAAGTEVEVPEPPSSEPEEEPESS